LNKPLLYPFVCGENYFVERVAMKKNLFIVLAMLTAVVCIPVPLVYAGPGSSSTTTTVTARFHDNHDGTITDTATELIWIKDGSASGSKTWADATAWCNTIDNGTAGLTDGSAAGDWRLPGKDELLGLISGWTGNDAIEWLDSQGFTNTQYVYWSSEQYNDSPDYAWVVTFITGTDGGYLKTQQTYARAVRTASTTTTTTSVAPRFHDNTDGTITDTKTELVWLRDGAAGGTKTWHQARDWCISLANGKAGLTDGSLVDDWRMPTTSELMGLINGWSGDRPSSWLDAQGFTNTGKEYWVDDNNFSPFAKSMVNFYYGSPSTLLYAALVSSRAVRAGAPLCTATMVLGPGNPLLENLRAFRNRTLAQSTMGRKFIEIYYHNAAGINAALGRNPALRAFTKRALEFIAPLMGRKEE
jgi:hypothetical protein